MKTKTLELFAEHMETNRIYFPTFRSACDIHLTRSEICDILSIEYGIRPKRKRVFNKKLKQLINSLMDEIVEEIRENVE